MNGPISPLAPVLRGEGSGVRGCSALDWLSAIAALVKALAKTRKSQPRPLTPAPLPRNTGGEGYFAARARAAYTLIELVVSLVVSVVLVGGLSAAVLLTSKSLEGSGTPSVAMVEAGDAADQLSAELATALKFTERTATAVTFTVPDRNGDAQPETIRYAWSGAGAALTRQYNGAPSPAAAIADGVQSFSLEYLTKTLSPPTRESIVQAHAYYINANADSSVSQASWKAQYFQPVTPANATSWKLTKLRLYLKRTINTTLSIRVSAADANKRPIGSPLATVSLNTSSLSSSNFSWVDVNISGVSGRSPGSGLVLQITGTGFGTLVTTRDRIGSAPANLGYSTSGNLGSSWTVVANSALQFQALGTVTTQ